MDRAPADLPPPAHSTSPGGATFSRLRRSSRTLSRTHRSPGGPTSRTLIQTPQSTGGPTSRTLIQAPQSIGGPTSRTLIQAPQSPAGRTSRTLIQAPQSPATHAPETREIAPLRHRHVRAPPPDAFITPTRMARSKYATVFGVESPNNDGEFQQDIVWDANSPSPVRAGKRGQSRTAGAAIGIPEIVRRIAPMHGRPAVVEPALQVWIEIAAIPCTPEEHHPKKKSPRPNGVDDLLKLAKQFDFNMFRKDEEQAEEMHKQTLELLSEDILEGPLLADSLPPAPEMTSKISSAVSGLQDYYMDTYFDQPMQDHTRNLSQTVYLGSLESSSSGAAGGAPRCATPPVSPPAEEAAFQVDDDWEKDWENDDFLNDTGVMEIPPNPLCLAPPKHCSTQSRWDGALPGSTQPSRGTPSRLGGEGCLAEKEPRMAKNLTTFKLDANPLSLNGQHLAASQASMTNLGTPQSEALSIKNPPVSGSHPKRPSHPPTGVLPGPPVGPQPKTSLANASAEYTVALKTSITSNKLKENQPTRSSNIQATATISSSAAAPGQELPPVVPASDDYQDLDELFSSEPGWDEEGDDKDDDDLLCQMCEDLDTQTAALERPAVLKQPLWLNKKPNQETQRPAPAAVPPRAGDQQKVRPDAKVLKQPLPSAPAPPPVRGSPPDSVQSSGQSANPFTGNTLPRIHTTSTESKHAKSGGLRGHLMLSGSYGGGPPPKAMAGHTGQSSIKKPLSPGIQVTPTGPKKCSMAEIELKKRQALERRRQHLQGPQSLGAPTRGR